MRQKANSLVPLSSDLELRQPGAPIVNLDQFLRPRLETYLIQLDEALQRLRTLAADARRSENPNVEAAFQAKYIDRLTKILKLYSTISGGVSTSYRPEPLQNSDIPDLKSIPAEARKHFKIALDLMKNESL